MLDFAIKLNNTKYLTCLEKSSLWRKLTDIAQDPKCYAKERKSFERLFLYLLADWKQMLAYDHFGRPSIFTKLLKQVLEKCPPGLKGELDQEAAPKLQADFASHPDPREVKEVKIPRDADLDAREYFEELTLVAAV